MLHIGKTIISDDIIEKDFVCNLNKCKGICCVEGESGAPLNENELPILEEIYDKVIPYMRPEGIAAIEKQGKYVIDSDGDYVTPLVSDKTECAYLNFQDNGMALCAIEQANTNGDIDYKKPISCHLYPVRIQEYSSFAAVNYHHWSICDDACTLGKELQVPVYKFLKEPLIRKFGPNWYSELEKQADEMIGSK